jgi:tetraacyldisaccharide 4'-kinase
MLHFGHIQRPILLPFSPLYWLVVWIRNLLFNLGVLRSTKFNIPVISLGNITVGGTGKTTHVEYLVRLLKNDYKVAVLSRGYKRKSGNFMLAAVKSHVHEIGDESLQIKRKFPEIPVAVNNNRVDGVKKLIRTFPKLDVVILDDAYQHRYIKPGLSILLVDYNRPVFHDVLLPAGNLREPWRNSKRADIIIVAKCPLNLSPSERANFTANLKLTPKQRIFFTSYNYETPVAVFPGKRHHQEIYTYKQLRKIDAGILLVTGIANPKPLKRFLEKNMYVNDEIAFPDHHQYTYTDLLTIKERLGSINAPEKYIVVTEKDAIRLRELEIADKALRKAFIYIPVEVGFLAKGEKPFIKRIYKYLKKAVK